MSGITPSASAIAGDLRDRWPKNVPVLYHGTRSIGAVMRSGAILAPNLGYRWISLTRRPEVAVYWATLERGEDDEEGAVLVLDRTVLAARHRIQPFRDTVWDDPASGRAGRQRYDEAEETVEADRLALEGMLLDVVRMAAPRPQSAPAAYSPAS